MKTKPVSVNKDRVKTLLAILCGLGIGMVMVVGGHGDDSGLEGFGIFVLILTALIAWAPVCLWSLDRIKALGGEDSVVGGWRVMGVRLLRDAACAALLHFPFIVMIFVQGETDPAVLLATLVALSLFSAALAAPIGILRRWCKQRKRRKALATAAGPAPTPPARPAPPDKAPAEQNLATQRRVMALRSQKLEREKKLAAEGKRLESEINILFPIQNRPESQGPGPMVAPDPVKPAHEPVPMAAPKAVPSSAASAGDPTPAGSRVATAPAAKSAGTTAAAKPAAAKPAGAAASTKGQPVKAARRPIDEQRSAMAIRSNELAREKLTHAGPAASDDLPGAAEAPAQEPPRMSLEALQPLLEAAASGLQPNGTALGTLEGQRALYEEATAVLPVLASLRVAPPLAAFLYEGRDYGPEQLPGLVGRLLGGVCQVLQDADLEVLPVLWLELSPETLVRGWRALSVYRRISSAQLAFDGALSLLADHLREREDAAAWLNERRRVDG